MKCFSKFKVLFCLVFAFMFMFGNALFVQAAPEIVFDEAQPLVMQLGFDGGNLEFCGSISYRCVIDPYIYNKGKKITSVESVEVHLSESCDYGYAKLSFEQIDVKTKLSFDGQEVRGFVYGIITEEADGFKLTQPIKLPFIYCLPHKGTVSE